MANWVPLSPMRPQVGIAGQNLTLGASSVASAAFGPQSYMLRVSSLGNCHVRIAPASTPLAAPVANTPTTSTTGGTLAAATYYYVVTALNSAGQTLASNEVSVTTTGTTSSNTITWSAVPGATGYRVYRGTAAAGENVYYAPGNVTTYTDTNASSTGGTPPGSNTTAIAPVAVGTDMLIKASDPPWVIKVAPGEMIAVIQDAAGDSGKIVNITEQTF